MRTLHLRFVKLQDTIVCLAVIWSFAALAQTHRVLTLDGRTGYVTVPDSPALRFSSGDFSICAWVWLNSYRGDNQVIAAKREPGSYHGWMFYMGGGLIPGTEAKRPVFIVSGFADPRVVGNTELGTNKWRHLAVVFHSAGSRADLYMDALLSGTALVPQPLTTTTNLFIGQDTRGNPYYFDGRIDEISIWNKALTTNDIQSAMACRLSGFEPSLVAYWNFDDGNARDLTGNGHNGTFNGNTSVISIQGGDVIHQGCGLNFSFDVQRLRYSSVHGFRQRIQGPSGIAVGIETSTNLNDWQPLIIFTDISGQVEFIDLSAINFTQRFYRMVPAR